MELLKNIQIINKTLFLKKEKTLIISDLHIGQDEALNSKGLLMPRFQYEDIFKETQKIIKEIKPKRIILNGDVKHEFSGILKEEREKVQEYIKYLMRTSEVILIKGNHDSILKPLADKLELELDNYYELNDVLICHGDKLFEIEKNKKIKTIIIGHEHPALTLREGARAEKYKCYLIGEYKNKNLIVMPSMNPLNEGTDILQEQLLSPYLKNNKNFKNFKAIIIDENKTYDFGKLRDIEK